MRLLLPPVLLLPELLPLAQWTAMMMAMLLLTPSSMMVSGNETESSSAQPRSSLPRSSSRRQELRARLLENYDRFSFPFDTIWEQQGLQESENNSDNNTNITRRGLPVQVGLNFHRVFEVETVKPVADLVVWVRQQWKDPRLAWNTTEYPNVSNLHFWIGGGGPGGETSEIWTPDLVLWNAHTPLDISLTDTYAVVSSDGTVFWSRPGRVQAICKFRGLEDFPFDTLGCTMEIGSWSFSGMYLRPSKLGEGFSVGGSETAGESFAEFSLQSVECEEYVYPPFEGNQASDWPVLLYHVKFERAWEPYFRGYFLLQVLLNMAAVSCFWLPPHSGERMSISITAVLAAVASELTIAEHLPASGEWTWFAKVSLVSRLITVSGMFISAMVCFLHYYTGESLIPEWFGWFLLRLQRDRAQTNNENSLLSNNQKGLTVHLEGSSREENKHKNNNNNVGEEKSPGYVKAHNSNSTCSCHSTSNDENAANNKDATISPGHQQQRNVDNRGIQDVDKASSSSAARNDQNSSSETATTTLLERQISSHHARQTVKTLLGRDADDFHNAKEVANNAYWQTVAVRIDHGARIVFPIALIVMVSSALSVADLS